MTFQGKFSRKVLGCFYEKCFPFDPMALKIIQ